MRRGYGLHLWQQLLRSGVVCCVLIATQSCSRGTPENVLRFTQLNVFDPNAGVNAFSVLVPKGWQHEGGIVWRPHLSNQAAVSMRIWNPHGSEVLELMPCDPFTWNPQALGFFRPDHP